MTFQDKLQLLRKKLKLSQEELAEKIGISRQAVAKWEAGQAFPDMENLVALSTNLHISIDRLIKPNEDCSAGGVEQGASTLTPQQLDYLCRAKKATYAGKGKEQASSRPHSHDLHHAEGNLLYIDSFLGGESFAGQEALWVAETPVWSMNYVGRVLGDTFSGDFLKDALLLPPPQMPCRGPRLYQRGHFTYHCAITGHMGWFQGSEEIFCGSDKVYECFFHGGMIV